MDPGRDVGWRTDVLRTTAYRPIRIAHEQLVETAQRIWRRWLREFLQKLIFDDLMHILREQKISLEQLGALYHVLAELLQYPLLDFLVDQIIAERACDDDDQDHAQSD